MLWLIAIVAAPAVNAQECGPDEPCVIENGSFHLRLPEGEGPHPVLIWFHGANSNGRSIHSSGGLQRDFLEQGFALIAPNGQTRAGRNPNRFFFPSRSGSDRDDVAFTFAALEAAQDRADLNMDMVYAAGFSAGGSMAWLLACEAGDRLKGMVSVAGALRHPNPTDCGGLTGLPVMQVHGFADAQVPLEGRGIREWHQGSVWNVLERARVANGCRSNPDEIEINAEFRTRLWATSCAGAPVRIDMHDGGHGLPRGWTGQAKAFFDSTSRLVQ